MATNLTAGNVGPVDRSAAHDMSLPDMAMAILRPLASLRLTVALLGMAIFIVFAGTMAQWQKDIWQVVADYFRTPIAWIDFQIFFPPSFFPSRPTVPGGFWFPGGWAIGTAMFVNLLAAHGIRFKPQASGTRLWLGLGVIAVGLLVTWAVVASGSNKEGVLEGGLIPWSVLWTLCKAALAALTVASLWALVRVDRQRKIELWGLVAVSTVLVVSTVWLVYEGEAARLNDSGMRILWQLIKGTLAGLVLLVGAVMVFKKRAGVVLLHAGVGLMMFSELLVGTTAVESQMQIPQGEVRDYAEDHRFVELALVDTTAKDHDEQLVVPGRMLKVGEKVADPHLPIDVEVVRYFPHAVVPELMRPVPPMLANAKTKNLATAGLGLKLSLVDLPPSVGTDSDGAVDTPAAYVELFRKGTKESLGTYMVSTFAAAHGIADDLEVNGHNYELALRFERHYKPYSVSLLEARKDDYIGTNTPRNYSSDVRIVDRSRDVDRTVHIWMNNPLRFAGETFYQSGFHREEKTGEVTTTLSVVSNTGWMIPYVACMIVAVGMLAHFSIALSRFLRRRAEEASAMRTASMIKPGRKSAPAPRQSALATWFPIGVTLAGAFFFASESRVPQARPGDLDLYAFGKLPVVYEGRVKPLDTLARNTLLAMSDRQSYTDTDGKRQPAIRWLLDTMAGIPGSENQRVIHIDNPEVLDTLGLERREKHLYSPAELDAKTDELRKQFALGREAEAKKLPLSVFQERMLELSHRWNALKLVEESFLSIPFPVPPSDAELEKDKDGATKRFMQDVMQMITAARKHSAMLAENGAPRLVPVVGAKEGESWQTYPEAQTQAYSDRFLGNKPNPFTLDLTRILMAYYEHDAAGFDGQVERYADALARSGVEDYNPQKLAFEAFFNHFEPFFWSAISYLLVFILAIVAWLGWSKPLNRAALGLALVTFLVHAGALVGRIYISGRPPVTNLYSAAVFVGFASVLLGLVLEGIYRGGFGNLIVGVTGFSTLWIAHFLAARGDTFVVLQAVLDTQFWLATHVVCITLGYATTYTAGMLGVAGVIFPLVSAKFTAQTAKELSRMLYGMLCFSIFFSFVGTVLGGLWADDSWGRFWGWDPKENGALMIVLWNALVLHARWGGMVGDRGLAVLAVAGNIFVSWSGFGVNELGIGLHSYGGSGKGGRIALAAFIGSQLLIMSLALLPRRKPAAPATV